MARHSSSAITAPQLELFICAGPVRALRATAHGQGWAIYGFAQMFSFTGDPSYLETSVRVSDWYIENLPVVGLPFWDFDAPYVPNVTPRDSSSATIAASGLLLMQKQIKKSGRFCISHICTDAAVRLMSSVVNSALAGEISFADLNVSDPKADLLQRRISPRRPTRAFQKASRAFSCTVL